MLKAEYKNFSINGKNLHTKFIFNSAAAKDDFIVFLHDGLGAIESFGDFPERLVSAVGMNAFLYNRPNYGGSDSDGYEISTTYMHRQAWNILPELLNAAGINNPGFYGYSDGGTIALLYAAKHPGGTKFVISEAAHVIWESMAPLGIRNFLALKGDSLADKLKVYHGNHAEDVIRYWSDNWTNPDFADFNISSDMRGITAPVLAFQGSKDEYATPIHLELISGNIAGIAETFIIEGGRHNMTEFRSGIILDKCVEFVGKVTSFTN